MEEQLEWFKVFTIVCQRTSFYSMHEELAAAERHVFPIVPKKQLFSTIITSNAVDDLSQTAFQLAYRDIRLRYGLSGGTKVLGSLNEVEMLGMLTMDILKFEVNISQQLTLGRDITTATSTARELSEGDTNSTDRSCSKGSHGSATSDVQAVSVVLPAALGYGVGVAAQNTWASCQSTCRYMRDAVGQTARYDIISQCCNHSFHFYIIYCLLCNVFVGRNLVKHIKEYKSQMKESINESIDVLVHPYMKQVSGFE